MRWARLPRVHRGARVLIIAVLTLAGSAADARSQGATVKKIGKAIERTAEARAAAKATSQYDDTFKKYSKRYFGPAFDWNHFKAQSMAESNLDPNATSYVGARGLMQLMPSTYKMIQTKRPEFGAINDPEWNIAAGVMHDRYLWRLWSKDVTESERFKFMYASYRIIDHLTPQVDFPEELKRGNIAVAIFIAALFLSIAIIVGNALG